MKPNGELTREQVRMVANWMLSGPGYCSPGDLFRDHIRAVAAEMREQADKTRDYGEQMALERYADKLEGVE